MDKKSYNQTQKNESLKQIYLNQFLKKYPSKNVSKIIYNKKENFKEYLKLLKNKEKITEKNYKDIIKSFEKNKETNIELFAFCPRGFIGRGISSKIFVNSICFQLDFEDFLSIIKDHEYIHARHIKEGIKLKNKLEISYLNQNNFNQKILLLLDESIAYSNTIQKTIKKNNFSPQMKETIKIFKEIQKKLKKISKFNSVIEESAIKFQIKENLNVLKNIVTTS